MLVGVDGSEGSDAAAVSIVRVLGPHLGSLTLATVVDYETAVDHVGPTNETDRDRAQADARLTAAADDLEASLGWRPSAVVLAGKPAPALLGHAHDEHFDLVAIGRRGRGLSKVLVGSCATELAQASSVPVIIVPAGDGHRRGVAQ